MLFIRKSILSIFILSFFVVAFPILNSQNYNYVAYITLLSFFVLLLFISIYKQIRIDSVIIYLLWFLFSILINYSLFDFRDNYSNYIFPLLALSLYIFISNHSNENMITQFLNLLIFLAVIESILGMSQSLFGFPYFSNASEIFQSDRNYLAYLIPSISSFVTQGTGTFEHFNGLGGLLSLVFPYIFGWWYSKKNNSRLFIMLIVFGGLFMTYSRGALIGSIVGIFYIIYMSPNRNKNIWKMIVFISIIVIFVFWNVINDYYNATENYSVRDYAWTVATSIALENPSKLLWGYGMYYFQNNVMGFYGTITSLHSGQLQIFLELGLIGIMLFLISFWEAIKNSITDKNILSISLAGGVLSFFTHQLFDNSMFNEIAVVYFIFIGIIKKNHIDKLCQTIFS